MTVNQAAFFTVTALAIATGGSVFAAAAAAKTAATVATVAYSILAIGLGAVSIASITAWLDKDSTSAEDYFSNIGRHAAIAIPAAAQVVAQTLLQSLIQGLADLVRNAISGNRQYA